MPDQTDRETLNRDLQKALDGIEAHRLPVRAAFLGATLGEVRGELSGLDTALERIETGLGDKPDQALVEKTRAVCSRLLSLPEFEEFTRTGSLLADEATELIDSARTIGEKALDYEQRLEESENKLDGAVSADDVRRVVEEIKKQTDDLIASNRDLYEQLTHSLDAIQVLSARLDEVRRIADTDEVTDLFNRRHFESRLSGLVKAGAGQPNSRLCLIFFDIDGFKGFNDRYGHPVGDMVLKLVARILESAVRENDICARYGGDEFVVALPDISLDDAQRLAERLRARMAETPLRKRGTEENYGKLTISMGLTRLVPEDSMDSFVSRADEALLEAKRAGRNRLIVRVS